MNTYQKYCPNVFVAKCLQRYAKDTTITMTTKYGKEHEAIVWNFLFEKDGFYYHSITRADGLTSQDRAKAKAERLTSWAASAEKRSTQKWEASQEGRDFLRLAEPIKIGHHSERRHRALIDRNHKRIRQAIEESNKAEKLHVRAEYWEERANKIDLSMPESLEFYQFKLEEATENHRKLKAGEVAREHAFSLSYSKKFVNYLTKQLQIAEALWG